MRMNLRDEKNTELLNIQHLKNDKVLITTQALASLTLR
jgi:hypothetical protein